MYANCLRHLPDGGTTIAELVGRARTATNLDGMRRSSGPPPAFGPGRQVWGRPAPG